MTPLLHAKIVGQGKPFLILHGLLGMGDNWISLARRYANHGFEVHLIDLRNHGKSFHDDEMNYEAMVDDLIHYININQLQKIYLMGHSMGGKTAMFFAMQYPEKLHKLIVVDITPKKYPPHHQFIFEAIEQIDLKKFNKREDINQFLSKKISSTAIRNFLLKNLKRDATGKFDWKPNIKVLKNNLNDLGEPLPPYTVFTKPVLFIKGEKSPYILANDEKLIKAHFPNSEIIQIPESGHWVHAEQSEIFFNRSLTFLLNNNN